MRTSNTLVSLLSLAALSSAAGQVAVGGRGIGIGARGTLMPSMALRMESPRAVIGVSTSASTGSRDTLGLLVSTVTRNGPAEKAGIEEGNRIAAINGISLKLAAADLGDPDMENLMSRRLIRELDKVKPGDEVELKVFGGGQLRTMKVKTVDPDSLYSAHSVTRRSLDERPTLGLSIGSSGSKRDTLGIFVMSVVDGGPAAKAGVEEGQRIAAINGVDLRVAHDDAGDDIVSSARVSRFEREISKLKVGDAVDLKVFANGQTRTVRVTTVAASALPGGHGITIIRDGSMIRRVPPMDIQIDGEEIGASVRAALEKAQAASGARLEEFGKVMDRLGRELNGGTVRWFNDETPNVDHIAPMAKQPDVAPPRKIGRTVSM